MKIKDWDRNLKVRLFGEALMNITFWMFFPFMTIYFTDAFGKDKAGILLILSQLFGVFANLLGGYYSDSFGRKKMMVISAYGQGIAFFIFAFVHSPWLELPLIGFLMFTIATIFGSMYRPASQAMVADVVIEKERSNVFAVFYTSTNIAVVIGPILGAIFYLKYPFELLIFGGIMCIILATLLLLFTKETAPSMQTRKIIKNNETLHLAKFLLNQFQDYVIIVKDKIFLLFILGGILAAQTFMQLDLLIPVFSKEKIPPQTLLHFGDWNLSVNGEKAFGIILSENGLLVALFTVVVTRWMSRYKEKNVFMLSSFSYGIAMIIFSQIHTVWGLIFAMAIFTFGELSVVGIQQSFVSRLSPENLRGQYFAAASLRFTLGKTIAPVAILISNWLGFEWTFVILAGFSFLSAGIYYLMFALFEKPKRSRVNIDVS